MPILLLVLGTVLALIPVLTNRLYLRVYQIEREQIALDNVAILLGQGDRQVLQELVRQNRNLKHLEKLHHAVHTCAPIDSRCLAADRKLETAIRYWHETSYAMAQKRWAQSYGRASQESNRLQAKVCRLQRSHSVPIESVKCSQCGLEVFWEWRRTEKRSFQIESCHPFGLSTAVGLLGTTLREGNWNYILKTEP